MNTIKGNKPKESEPGKADLERAENQNEPQNIIPSDTILAEKDEVKNAEERLRLKKEEVKGKSEN